MHRGISRSLPSACWCVPHWLRVVALALLACILTGCSDAPLRPEALLDPHQTPTTLAAFEFQDYHITPLADFDLTARVLGSEHYRFDGGSKLAKVDLALGWGPMAEPKHYKEVQVTQSGRWYRWRSSPSLELTPDEVSLHSANMHLIAADEEVENTLLRARAHDQIHITGQLVYVRGPKGFFWKSSLTREDTGSGSCELVYVTAAHLY